MKGEKGFSLVTVMLLTTVILVLGSAAFYVSNYGYNMINANTKYRVAEQKAEYGIMKALEYTYTGTSCENLMSKTYGDGIQVTTSKAGNNCLIKAVGTFGNAQVAKIAIAGASSTNYASVVMCNLTNLNMSGSSSIESCNSNCPTHALITGNNYSSRLGNINLNRTCGNNNKGLTAYNMDPYKYDSNLCKQQNLLSTYFNGISNRNELFNKMTQIYGVAFDNGRPIGLTTGSNPLYLINTTDLKNIITNTTEQIRDLCSFVKKDNNNTLILDIGTVTGSGNTLTASSCYNISETNIQVKLKFTWDSTRGSYQVGFESCTTGTTINTVIYCKNINLGQNTRLDLGGNFTGGGALAAQIINFNGDVNPSNLTLVATNNANMQTNNVNIQNVNIFAQNYEIKAQNLTVENSLIFGGGGGQNINITLNSNSKLGTPNNPVLIISDNNINIGRNGNAEINGIIYATPYERIDNKYYGNNSFNINEGNGDFTINGMITSEGSNNNININGNFTIRFDPDILSKVASRFNNLLKPPTCGSVTNLRYTDIITKQTLY